MSLSNKHCSLNHNCIGPVLFKPKSITQPSLSVLLTDNDIHQTLTTFPINAVSFVYTSVNPNYKIQISYPTTTHPHQTNILITDFSMDIFHVTEGPDVNLSQIHLIINNIGTTVNSSTAVIAPSLVWLLNGTPQIIVPSASFAVGTTVMLIFSVTQTLHPEDNLTCSGSVQISFSV